MAINKTVCIQVLSVECIVIQGYVFSRLRSNKSMHDGLRTPNYCKTLKYPATYKKYGRKSCFV